MQRGGITKTGNAHLRRMIVEGDWAYQHKPWIGGWLARRQQGLDEDTKAIAWKRTGVWAIAVGIEARMAAENACKVAPS